MELFVHQFLESELLFFEHKLLLQLLKLVLLYHRLVLEVGHAPLEVDAAFDSFAFKVLPDRDGLR